MLGRHGNDARTSPYECITQQVFLATAFRFCAGFGIGVWCAPFFRGRFPSNSSEYAVLNAFVVAGGGLLSSFLGGVISDKYSVKVSQSGSSAQGCYYSRHRGGEGVRWWQK